MVHVVLKGSVFWDIKLRSLLRVSGNSEAIFPPKPWLIFKDLHGVISQKIEFSKYFFFCGWGELNIIYLSPILFGLIPSFAKLSRNLHNQFSSVSVISS